MAFLIKALLPNEHATCHSMGDDRCLQQSIPNACHKAGWCLKARVTTRMHPQPFHSSPVDPQSTRSGPAQSGWGHREVTTEIDNIINFSRTPTRIGRPLLAASGAWHSCAHARPEHTTGTKRRALCPDCGHVSCGKSWWRCIPWTADIIISILMLSLHRR